MNADVATRRVLVSHLTADRGWAQAFTTAVRSRGIDAVPHELELDAGRSGLSSIEGALRGADDLVFLVSGDPASKAWMFFEFGVASLGGKRFVPIVPIDLDMTAFPVPMQSRRFVTRRSPEQTAAELYDVEAVTRSA